MVILYVQGFVHCDVFPSFTKLSLVPANASGPEALAFKGAQIYTGVQDGRILEYDTGSNCGFVDFATTSPLRTKKICDGANATAAATCGRPLGLGWNYLKDELYIMDSKFGFLVVSRNGGLATQLATGFNGSPFGFLDALDIDQRNQFVYFTDAGAIFQTQNLSLIVQNGDSSGKLYKYNIRTKQISLLLDGLFEPTGVAVSRDGRFLVISESIANRIRKFWLRGPSANSSHVLINLENGYPDNIRRTPGGHFFVAVNTLKPPPAPLALSSFGLKFNRFGRILKALDLTQYYNDNTPVTEVQEIRPGLYFIGSLMYNFVGKYILN